MQKEPAGEKITYVLNVRSRFKLMMLSMRGSHKFSHLNKACSLFAQFAKLRIKRGNMVLFLTTSRSSNGYRVGGGFGGEVKGGGGRNLTPFSTFEISQPTTLPRTKIHDIRTKR